MMTNRRTFLTSTAGAVAAGLLAAAAPAANEKAPMHPSAALKNLMDGNARFAAGAPRPPASIARVRELASGQSPFATVLACSDSRVPVEILFDHDPGDIFVVRVAGNFVTDPGLGSIEYATAVLKSPLVMVLGHTACGAVKAAIEFVEHGKTFPGQIQVLAEAIAPAARETAHDSGDRVRNAVAANVRLAVQRLKAATPIMAHAVNSREIEVVGGVYDLSTGKVSLL
jgi:carbonic anhydrase